MALYGYSTKKILKRVNHPSQDPRTVRPSDPAVTVLVKVNKNRFQYDTCATEEVLVNNGVVKSCVCDKAKAYYDTFACFVTIQTRSKMVNVKLVQTQKRLETSNVFHVKRTKFKLFF